MTRAGVVAVQRAGHSWAWAAVQVEPVVSGDNTAVAPARVPPGRPATVHNEHSGQARNLVQAGQLYGDVHLHHEPAPEPVPDDSAWLRSCGAIVARFGATVEIRYLTRSGRPGIDGFLLMRAEGSNQDEAEHRVAALREQLTMLPRHVTGTAVTDKDRTRWILDPFPPCADGIVEIRKRLTVQRTSRGDARRPWLTAVTPLTHRPRSWKSVWSEMARLPFRALLSVGLVPYPVGPGLRAHLTARAAELARLARQGPYPTAVWSVPRPPDEFAAAAHELMSDAVRRYTGHAFLIRISLASERPLPGALAESVAGTISARTAGSGFAGAPPVVVRPTAAEMATAWNNITALNFAPLPAYDQGHPAQALGDLERTLASIVDLDEAGAAFRLPQHHTGSFSPITAD